MATTQAIRQRIARGPVVLDGATGTELERRGVRTGLPLWSAAALTACPDVVEAIHREYVAAGADVIVANTFRTNPRALRRAGRFGEGPDLNRLAVRLARRAVAERPVGVLVAASVAPVEDCYCPERTPNEGILREEHGHMAAWLAGTEPDLLWIETMGTVREARVAAEAAAALDLPFAVSFVVAETGDLLGGEPLEAGVAAVEPFAPLAIGLNCIPPRGMTTVLPRLRRATDCPLSAYAHINNPSPIRGWSFAQALSPAEYAGFVREWIERGATVVGGCCGTTPAHIGAIRESV